MLPTPKSHFLKFFFQQSQQAFRQNQPIAAAQIQFSGEAGDIITFKFSLSFSLYRICFVPSVDYQPGIQPAGQAPLPEDDLCGR